MNWKVKIAKGASKAMKRFPKKDAERLLFVLEEFQVDPYQGDIEKIRGEDNVWRRRVGNYRILYEVVPRQKSVDVFRIERRTTTTYKKR